MAAPLQTPPSRVDTPADPMCQVFNRVTQIMGNPITAAGQGPGPKEHCVPVTMDGETVGLATFQADGAATIRVDDATRKKIMGQPIRVDMGALMKGLEGCALPPLTPDELDALCTMIDCLADLVPHEDGEGVVVKATLEMQRGVNKLYDMADRTPTFRME
jgi:hypothetical protein